MNKEEYNTPLSLQGLQITDPFWTQKMELIRKEVIPYQWEALNDRVEGAAPSFCMHNFRVAAERNSQKREQGADFQEPAYTFRGFEILPEDPAHPADTFYGFVFQDSDVYKWLEAVAYTLTWHPDPALEQLADDAIGLICQAQQEDGYLDTCYMINGRERAFTNLRDHHELYCFGHLAEAAAAYYEATGKDRLLKAAQRFADYIADFFGPEDGQCKGYPGHKIAEMALIRLYETTHEQKYLDLSRFFIDERGTRPYYYDSEHPEAVKKGAESEERYAYHQAHRPVREQREAVGHAVRAVYLYSGMADAARLTADESLYAACTCLWDSITKQKMYLTGGIGATHIGEAFSFGYDLPNDTAYAETCASIGLVFFARRMLQIRPEAKYANVMERALCNGILSGMSLDGKSFFYVNPLEVLPEACHKDGRKSHVKPVRQKWFGCACCPPNLARLISSIGSYAFTENEDTLFVHLYLGSRLTKNIGPKTAEIQMESDFPWEGNVKILIRAHGAKLKLALRIPDWCDTFTLTDTACPSQKITPEHPLPGHTGQSLRTWEKDGYLYVEKDWAAEDCLTLSFPMEVRLIAANPKVREDIGKAAVSRGPLVYCMEESDNGPGLHLLSLSPEPRPLVSEADICGTKAAMLSLNGFRITETGDDSLYRTFTPAVKKETVLKFVPYYLWGNRGENEMQVWTRIEI